MKIAYSPCPNDTFVFHAWAHGLVPGAPALDVTFADIDITNGMAGAAKARRAEGVVRRAAVGAGRVRAAAVRRRARPGLRAAGADPGQARRTAELPARGRRAERAVHRLLAVPAVGGGERAGRGRRDRRHAVPRDHARRAGREGRRGARHPRGPFHVQDLRPHCSPTWASWWEPETGLPIPLGAIIARRGLGRRLSLTAGSAHPSIRLGDPEASQRLCA